MLRRQLLGAAVAAGLLLSDGKYALKASDTTGKETDDDLFISDTKTVKVGTVASPSSLAKTIRIPFGELVGTTGGSDYAMVQGYARPGTANTLVEMVGSVVLPKGVTITAFRSRLYRQNSGDTANAVLSRVDESNGNLTTLKTLVHATTAAWSTLSDSLTETVGDTTYRVLAAMIGVSNALDARCMWFEFDYTMPDYSKSY